MIPQPLSQQECLEAFLAQFDKVRKFIASEAPQSSQEWFNNMKEQFKHGFKWVDDNMRHANRRTCPKTNEKDRKRQPLPRNVTGYMSFDK